MKKPQPKNRTSAEALAERRKSFSKRVDKSRFRVTHLPVIPERVQAFTKVTIEPAHYSRLSIWYEKDGGYQREELKAWVTDIADAIRRGSVPDPIHVVRRLYSGGNDKQLWIVDGQQRFWALWSCNKPITAFIHEVKSEQEERDLFEVLNARKAVAANLRIFNHGGASAALLRRVESDPKHPLHKRVLFSSYSGSSYRVNAATLLRCLTVAIGSKSGDVMGQLSRVDKFIKDQGGDDSILDYFLGLLGTIFGSFGKTKPKADKLVAFALAWRQIGCQRLSAQAVARLKRLKLDNVIAATAQERILLMTRRIQASITPRIAGGQEEF